MDYNLYSFGELQKKYKISKTLLEYLNIEIIKKGKASYITQESLDKVLKFKEENSNTRAILQKYTCMKKYGVENPQQCKEIKDKTNKTIKEKYGVENISQSKKIKDKKAETSLKHFGVNNPSKSKDIQNKIAETRLNKYGDKNYGLFGSESYKNNIINKFGVDNAMKNKNIANKSKTNKLNNKIAEFEKYKDYLSVKEVCMIVSRCYDRVLDVIKLLNLEVLEIKDIYLIKKSDLNKIEDYFKTASDYATSNEEKDLLDFIKDLTTEKIISNDKSIINPYELDIYIPSKNLAFEFDGIYYHSNQFKDKMYHYNKTKLCEEKGIRLIHVFEDDWRFKQNIVKSMIKSSLGIYNRKIFARKCEIKNISITEYRNFMNENHLQGYTTASYYIGLYYNNELVQSIGIKYNGLNKTYELNRMATKLNTQVVGGFSKLIKYSVNQFNIKEMTSYVFKSWFNGNSYEICGFKFDKECPPTYWYIVNGMKVNRMNYQKKYIKEKFNKGKLKYYSDSDSEFDNMAKNGISWIWDSGKIKLKYKI